MNALLKSYWWVPVLLLMVGGWWSCWLNEHDAKVLAQHSADSLATAFKVVGLERAAERQARAVVDAARADTLRQLRAQVAVEHEANVALVGRLNVALAADSSLPDSLRGLIAATVAGFQAEVAGLRHRVALLDARHVSDSLTIAGLDSTVADLRGFNESTLKQLRIANTRANPGLLKRTWNALPFIAAGAVAGYAAAH